MVHKQHVLVYTDFCDHRNCVYFHKIMEISELLEEKGNNLRHPNTILWNDARYGCW